MRLVLIEWLDAFSTDDWTSLEELSGSPDPVKAMTKSVGWLTYDGEDFKTVVADIDDERGSRSMAIPTGYVKRIQDLHIDRAEVKPEDEH